MYGINGGYYCRWAAAKEKAEDLSPALITAKLKP